MKAVLLAAATVLATTSCGMAAFDAITTGTIVPPAPTRVTQPVAQPSLEDQAFAEAERLYGKTIYASRAEVIKTMRNTCRMLDQGMTYDELVWAGQTASDGDDESVEFLSAVIVAGVFYLCPEYTYMFD